MSARTAGFELKGWHVLAMLLGFFGVTIAVNVVFITAAVTTFPGEIVPKSYVQGLQYNQTLAARAEQHDRGWRAKISQAYSAASREAVIAVVLVDAAGQPVNGLALTGALARPATDDGETELAFTPQGAGRYDARANLAPGAWRVSLSTAFPDGAPFTAEAELWLR